MSFLAKYWNAVERAVSETGMNPGDIIVNIAEVIKNTEVHDDVDFHVSNIPDPKQTTTPANAGSMPHRKPDIGAMEEAARRAARPGEEFDQLEERLTWPKAKVRSVRDTMAKTDTERPKARGKTSKAIRKAERKKLKKLGGGRKVRLVIDEVRINDRAVWPKPSADHRP